TERGIQSVVRALTGSSTHPVSTAVHEHVVAALASASQFQTDGIDVKSVPGKGLETVVDGVLIRGGSAAWATGVQDMGDRTVFVVSVATDPTHSIFARVAHYTLSDSLRPDAASTIKSLIQRGLEVHILSGDNSRVVERTAATLDIPLSHARGSLSPEEKAHWIEFLQRTKFDPESGDSKHRKVMFVGDGTNDALALVQADVGVSLGGGTDVASSAAQVVLLSSLHTGLLELFSLARAARRRVWINFAWAGVYNAVAILLACGVLGRARIPPQWAGLGELVSVLPVVSLSPTGRPGSLNDPVDTRMPPHDATRPDSRAKIAVPNSGKSSKGNAWTGLEQALRALRVTTTICPSLSTAVDELVSFLHLFEVATKKHKDYHDLTTGLEDIVNQLARHLNGTTSKAIIDTITSIANAIRKEIASIDVQQSHNLPRRMLGASSTEDDLIRRYRRIEQLFRQLQGEAGMSTWNTVDELRVEQHLKDLRPAKLARFNSELSTEVNRRRCTHGTRTNILEDSATWSEDPDLAKVYWMNGMAGTGKTTIAYSLCERLEAGKQLAASFFCTRTSPECREAKRIIPTIAYQLARRFTPFRYSLCQQLKQDPDISTGQLSDQFDLLLKQPLLAAKDKLSNTLVIVVDALDECSDSHIVELFLDLLFRSVMELPVKFFVTSRPEPAIRNKMMPESEQSRSILYLHEIERSLVQADIELYLRDELASISPADDDITELAEHAGSLFIYAATAVRYIRPVGKAVNSKARLKAILAVSTQLATSLSAIDSLYTAILTDALYDQEFTHEEQNQMRLVLHIAICACEPILIQTLSALCGLEDKDDAIAALQPLRSVLHVSDHTELVTTLHASFPDFMFDHNRSGAFYCDKAEQSRFLSEMCLSVMTAQLRFNICSIPSSFVPNDQVPGLEDRITTNISEELSYTCRFWVDHLSATDPDLTLLPLVDTFMSQQLLFWMEVMSLKSCMVLGVIAMTKLNTWLTQLQQHTRTNLLALASDAQSFVGRYASSPASSFTSHIYLSALPLTPSSSAVRSRYLPQFKGLIKATGTRFNTIDNASLGIWAPEHSVRSTTLSPDGNRIVLGDEKGNISVRNAYDGKYIVQPFKAHKKFVAALAISSDGMHIASGSHDMTLSVWSIYDGSLTAGPFKGHKGRVNSVAFSPDATLIVSGSKDCIVGVWDSHNVATAMRSLVGHKKEVKSVDFSPDGLRVISGSEDHTIRVWDVSSGTTILTLDGHTSVVSSVMFSPCGARIISGSYDHSIRIWNTSDGTLFRQPVTCHPGWVTSLALSPDGSRIVSGSGCKVRVWDIDSGELVAGPFEGHGKMITHCTSLDYTCSGAIN
ncbi:unnamed protein product, partial [Rhizoctonia solani]